MQIPASTTNVRIPADVNHLTTKTQLVRCIIFHQTQKREIRNLINIHFK